MSEEDGNDQQPNSENKARVLAVTNQKGGVGKTTTAVNLVASLARVGRRALLIDLDPQGNATVGSGVDKQAIPYSVYHVLVANRNVDEAIVATENGYSVAPATSDLAGASVELASELGREQRLKQALQPVLTRFDYIFIDCPPALDLLTINALAAADAVFIPVQCEYYALEGLTALLDTVKRVREILNPHLEIEGLVRTMFDGRNTLANEVSDQLKSHFGEKVYRTMIPRNIRLAEAPSYGQPVIVYDKHCVGTQAYLALAGELIRRNEM